MSNPPPWASEVGRTPVANVAMIRSSGVAVVESISIAVASLEEGMDEAPGASPSVASSPTMTLDVVVGESDLPTIERSVAVMGPPTTSLEICWRSSASSAASASANGGGLDVITLI